MYYRGSPKPAGRIAREVDAAYIVEGSFRRADPRFAAHVQLIRAADESHLWAHRFEFDLGDLLDRQSEAARSIVSRLGLSPRPVSRQTTQDPVAYRFYLQGRAFLWGSTPADLLRAKELLALAAARDPGFALAHVGLAELYWYWGFFGFLPPRQACSEGIYHALHALEIDNSAAETHALLALYRRGLDYCWEEVDREIGCARGLDPQSPFVRMVSAIVEMVHGRLDSAEREARASVELDPLNLFARSWRVFILHLTRDYDRALAEARLLLDLAPANPAAHSVTGFVLRQQGKLTEAIHHHRQAAELSGRSPMMLGWLGLALGLAGERVEARALLDELKVVAEKGKYVPATSFAWTYFALGELEEAFAWMRQAVDSGDLMIAPIKTYPFLDPVRSDPRFLDLLRRMNLTT
jgi:tetratricopeptide (TPR) repeat protein